MPRAIWSGAISFGLVNVPVKLFSAVSPKDVRFNQLEEGTGARIRQKRGHFSRTKIVGPAAKCGQNSQTTAVKTHERSQDQMSIARNRAPGLERRRGW